MKKTLVNYIISIITIFMIISFAALEFFHHKTLRDNLLKSEHQRLETILNTIAPIVSINMSFGLVESIAEPIFKIHAQNPSIIATTIYDREGNTVFNYKSDFNTDGLSLITKQRKIVDNLATDNSVLGAIEMSYYNKDYKRVISETNYKTLFLFLITITALIILSYILNKILSPLKKLSDSLNNYSPNSQLNLNIQSEFSEIKIINDTVNSLLERVYLHTKDLNTLNDTLEEKVEKQTNKLVELNRDLEEKIQKSIDEIRRKDKLMIRQAKLAQMGEMISMIAHQWKQPLTTITAITSNIKVKKEIGTLTFDETYNFMLNIEEKVEYLSSTVDDFRTFFKPNKEKESFQISNIIDDSLHLLMEDVQSLKLDKSYNSPTPVLAYKNELLQVFLNIFKNAIDIFNERNIEEKKISIVTFEENEKILTTIEDNGGGISDNFIDKIFEPYFTTKDEKNGTGLGMYMCKVIIDEHCKGSLEVENTPIGAKFTLVLPASSGS